MLDFQSSAALGSQQASIGGVHLATPSTSIWCLVPKLNGLASLTSAHDFDLVLAFGSTINQHLVFVKKLNGLASLTSERAFDLVLAFGSVIKEHLVFGAKAQWAGVLDLCT